MIAKGTELWKAEHRQLESAMMGGPFQAASQTPEHAWPRLDGPL